MIKKAIDANLLHRFWNAGIVPIKSLISNIQNSIMTILLMELFNGRWVMIKKAIDANLLHRFWNAGIVPIKSLISNIQNSISSLSSQISNIQNSINSLSSQMNNKAPLNHGHDYLPTTGGNVNGNLAVVGSLSSISNIQNSINSLSSQMNNKAPLNHGHDYLPTTGGNVNGNLAVVGSLSSDRYYNATPNKTMVFESGGFINIQTGQSAQVRNQTDTGWAAISAREFVQQSSAKYKENIEDMTEDYAKKLLELRPVSYDYKNKAKIKRMVLVAMG